MNKVKYISLIITCFIQSVNAQEQFSISQYYQTQSIINPGFTGVDDFLDVKIGYRQKWAGLNNSPTTSFISVMGSIGGKTSYTQSPIRISNPNQIKIVESQKAKIRSHGIGGYITKQEQGAFNQINAMLNYALHIPISPKIKVSMGTSFGISNTNVDLSKIGVWDKTNDPIYQSYVNGDGNYSRFLINVGGVMYGKKSYFGVSYLPIIDASISGYTQELAADQKIILMTGTKISAGPSLTIMPSILVETTSANRSKFVGSLLFDIKSLIKTGFAYSSVNDLSFNVMFNYKNNFGLAYAIETSLGNEATIGNGTHEVILSLNLFNHLNAAPRLW